MKSTSLVWRNALCLVAITLLSGYDFSCDDLIKLRHAGVTADYLASLHVPGQKNLPADVIVDLRRRGVPIKTVRQIRSHSN